MGKIIASKEEKFMKLDIVTKNSHASEKLTETLSKKLSKLDKYFAYETEARVVIRGEKINNVLEVTIVSNGATIRAEEKGKTAYGCVDKILPKLEKQIIRHREKFSSSKQKINDTIQQSYEFIKSDDIEALPEIIKTKKFEVSPISLSDAVAELELVDHDFYLFLNEGSGQIEAVYHRMDGKIGHLIPYIK